MRADGVNFAELADLSRDNDSDNDDAAVVNDATLIDLDMSPSGDGSNSSTSSSSTKNLVDVELRFEHGDSEAEFERKVAAALATGRDERQQTARQDVSQMWRKRTVGKSADSFEFEALTIDAMSSGSLPAVTPPLRRSAGGADVGGVADNSKLRTRSKASLSLSASGTWDEEEVVRI